MHHTITLNLIVYLKKAWCACFFSHFDACTGKFSLLGWVVFVSSEQWPRANVFPAGVASFGKAMYRSLERSTQDIRDGFFCTVPRPHFLDRALIWPGYFGEHILGLFELHPSSLSKSAGFVSLSEKASLVSLSAAILLLRSWHVYFSVGVRILWKKLYWMRAWRRRWHLVPPTLYIIIVYSVNLIKLSRNFVGALRTTSTNCRVSFIDLYLVFQS